MSTCLFFLLFFCLIHADKDAEDKFEAQKWLQEMRQQEGVIRKKSGLLYKVLVKGEGTINPTRAARCWVHFEGYLPDGRVFDSSLDQAHPTMFVPKLTMKGVGEALLQMHVGDQWELYMSSDLAYGTKGLAPAVGPNTPVRFFLELVSFEGDGTTPAPWTEHEEL
eukprot:NODE_6292_length_552_cov_14.649412_g6127_i0.p2 GENE.NODE_6292_length_552_cov_14.649412_g6127_i0~~NODE_6292_length_552_cov_14.649412_g6127_i0.p2  ORF type:complete len:165 (+),score=42.60 NODE_6292_length_552_cov_14.649412_g6127_i0:56-550(+)